MEKVTLVSWEGVKVQLPLESVNNSEFLKHCPDLNEEISLKNLEIDTFSLKLIQEFVEIQENVPVFKDCIDKETQCFEQQPGIKAFFQKVSEEELGLLVSAAYKLDFKDLQKACCVQIAKIFVGIPKEVLNEVFSIDELTIDEDDYLKFVWIKKSVK
jgi:hypothetical protein